MIELGRHAGYIIAAYAGAALLVGLAVLYVGLGAARVRRRLAALEARGIRRRSDETG